MTTHRSLDSPQPDFDPVARLYRWAEYVSLGPLLQRTRMHFLPQLAGRRRALVLGDGDGRFLARLLQQEADLHALAVDTSATMLQLLRQRCCAASTSSEHRLQTLRASALDSEVAMEIAHDTDLIVTHFFLDCLAQAEVDALAKQIAAHTQAGTLWLLSDFQIPPGGLIRNFARIYIRALYFAFRILTGLRINSLPAPQQSLACAGFSRIARHERLGKLIYTEIWHRD